MNAVTCKGCGELVVVDLLGTGLDEEEVERKWQEHRKKHADLEALWEAGP